MNSQTRLVLNGWLSLSAQEQSELIEAIQNYQRGTTYEKSVVQAENEDLVNHIKTYLGPLPDPCPCCGRT